VARSQSGCHWALLPPNVGVQPGREGRDCVWGDLRERRGPWFLRHRPVLARFPGPRGDARPLALRLRADVLSSTWPRCQELISGCSALQGEEKKKKERKKGVLDFSPLEK